MEELTLFGVQLINPEAFGTLLIKFAVDFVFAFIIIRVIYYRNNKKSEYLFTFFLFNVLIFFIASMLATVTLKTGFGFGLFAVFTMLRYRTETIEIKEMTFLFICTILGVINSLATSFGEIVFANLVIVTATYFLEIHWTGRFQGTMIINYDDIRLVNVNMKPALIEELENRTGLKVTNVEIVNINYLRDTADLRVFYERNTMQAVRPTNSVTQIAP